MNLKDFQRLKERLETLQRDSDRAAGARDQLMLRLKTEFGCDTLKQAQRELKRLETKELRLSERFEKALKEFEDEHDRRAIQ